jgi:hypothetical protein
LLAGWTALAAAALAQMAPPGQTSPPAGAAPAVASAPGTAGGPTIVEGVTVSAPLKDLPSAVSQFVHSHGAPSRRLEQITRWGQTAPICVVTAGLDPGFNDFVTRRVQAVAASVGAPVDTSTPDKPCARTIEILFTHSPQVLARLAFKRDGLLMGYHYPAEIARLSTFEPPIEAWYATGTRARNGRIVLDTINTRTLRSDNDDDSRLRTSFSSEFVNVLVIADLNIVAGGEIGPISDYMAMLILAQPRSLTACDTLPSILDLMAPHCSDQDKPKALTPADLAYLKALYALSGEQNLNLQRGNIADVMRRELTAAH